MADSLLKTLIWAKIGIQFFFKGLWQSQFFFKGLWQNQFLKILRGGGRVSGNDNSKALSKCFYKSVWAYGRFTVENVDLG